MGPSEVIVQTPNALSPEQREALMKAWEAMWRGSGNLSAAEIEAQLLPIDGDIRVKPVAPRLPNDDRRAFELGRIGK